MHPAVYVVIAFVAILILGFIWGRKMRQSKATVYIEFAHKYELEIHTADLQDHFIQISGNIDDHPFELIEKRIGLSKDSAVWTYLTFKKSSLDFDFQISADNMIMKAAKALADYEDVKIGHEELDKKYIFHSKDSAKMSRLFDTLDEIKLLEMYDGFLGMIENKAGQKTLQYIHQGRINYSSQMEDVERTFNFMRHLLKKR